MVVSLSGLLFARYYKSNLQVKLRNNKQHLYQQLLGYLSTDAAMIKILISYCMVACHAAILNGLILPESFGSITLKQMKKVVPVSTYSMSFWILTPIGSR